jgi:hypothetical protein
MRDVIVSTVRRISRNALSTLKKIAIARALLQRPKWLQKVVVKTRDFGRRYAACGRAGAVTSHMRVTRSAGDAAPVLS